MSKKKKATAKKRKKIISEVKTPDTCAVSLEKGIIHQAEALQAREGRCMPRGFYIQTKMPRESCGKRLIAKHIATTYVDDFDAVLLDAGSTAEMIAEEIFARRTFLSVLTNNMGAYSAYTCAKAPGLDESIIGESAHSGEVQRSLYGNELLVTGGRYDDTYESLLGEGATRTIEPFTPNIIILGISGLRYREGLFCHGAEEAAVKKLLCLKPTDTRLIAADWTKIGRRDAHSFGMLEQFAANAQRAVLVTCNPPDNVEPKELKSFEEQLRLIERSAITVDRVSIPAHK